MCVCDCAIIELAWAVSRWIVPLVPLDRSVGSVGSVRSCCLRRRVESLILFFGKKRIVAYFAWSRFVLFHLVVPVAMGSPFQSPPILPPFFFAKQLFLLFLIFLFSAQRRSD